MYEASCRDVYLTSACISNDKKECGHCNKIPECTEQDVIL